MGAFGAFPPEFWQLFLQSNLTALRGKIRHARVGMMCSRLAAGGVRQRPPRLKKIEVRQGSVE